MKPEKIPKELAKAVKVTNNIPNLAALNKII
jgi:hypothetical protein